MKIFKYTESFIDNTPKWKFVLTLQLVLIIKTGIWFMPNLGLSQLIAQNPFVNPFKDPLAEYVFWNWLGPFLAWCVGAIGRWKFFLFHLIFSCAFFFLFAVTAFVKLPERQGKVALVLFVLLPVSATAYFWVGMDSITLFLMMCCLALENFPFLLLGCGIALGMQHFEQSIFACGALLCALIISRRRNEEVRYRMKSAVMWFIGAILGKAMLALIFSYFNVVLHGGRLYWMKVHYPELLGQFFFHFHYIMWSVLGLGWLVGLKYAEVGKNFLAFTIPFLGLLLLLPISGDQTRVIAITSFPLIATHWLFDARFLESLNKRFVSFLLVSWFIVPWSWVWGGVPKWSVLPFDIFYIVSKVFRGVTVPADVALWPF